LGLIEANHPKAPSANNAHTRPSKPNPINLPENHWQVRVCKPLNEKQRRVTQQPHPEKIAHKNQNHPILTFLERIGLPYVFMNPA